MKGDKGMKEIKRRKIERNEQILPAHNLGENWSESQPDTSYIH
jgi:hypothetical protein